jgi:dimethylargininase
MYQNAIVLQPSPAIRYGITSSDLGQPDYSDAILQHTKYTYTLRELGLKVRVLPQNKDFPDSTFIEDVAVCTRDIAVITNPGAPSRKGETAGLRSVLEDYYNSIEEISSPGTLDGGDVMLAEDRLYVGISERTNNEGATKLIKILEKHGLKGYMIPLKNMLHLKSGVSYLSDNILLAASELKDEKQFSGFHIIEVDADESYAANSLWINGKVLVPEGFPKTRKKIEDAGFCTISLNVSEFRKVDGGLSCLSLRF